MKRVSPYLKMRVLGAIEYAPGASSVARIRHVAEQPFTDENGVRFQFTWRTIQTWYSRYKKDGITTMHPRTRSDRGVPITACCASSVRPSRSTWTAATIAARNA